MTQKIRDVTQKFRQVTQKAGRVSDAPLVIMERLGILLWMNLRGRSRQCVRDFIEGVGDGRLRALRPED